MSDCRLCELKGAFLRVTMCTKCGVPMVVHEDHKAEFSEEEKDLIRMIFPSADIRWRMRNIKNHAHCHIYYRRLFVSDG